MQITASFDKFILPKDTKVFIQCGGTEHKAYNFTLHFLCSILEHIVSKLVN